MYKLNYKDMSVKYTITKKSTKKNISLYVKYPGVVSVVAPSYTTDKFIHNFVKSKSDWIFNKIIAFKNIEKNSSKFTLDDKSKISYMGKEYQINIIKHNLEKKISLQSLEVIDNKFILNINSDKNQSEIVSKLLIDYYIKQGTIDIGERVSIYAKKLGIYPKKIKVKCQKTSWGSCSSLGNIYINYNLLLAPIDIIDYVLVHELCHFIEMNHSKNFWKLVENIVPDYKIKRHWLKENGHSLKFK